MPRLVRRRSLAERTRDYLNPYDWLMWISEELETSDYPWDEWAYVIGAVFNFLFMLGRANTSSQAEDDVFADEGSGGGFFGPLASFTVFVLSIFSFANAVYTFTRKRHYRLFEVPVEGKAPSTPSAKRVRVDSSPGVSSSPLRMLSWLVESSDESARSRAHPDGKRDVWEISVWDPPSLGLKLFCAFSPGHVLVYSAFLPVDVTDPRPGTRVATTLAMAGLLTIQLALLRTRFDARHRDSAVVQREVMAEYDAKFVRPMAHPLMRDVATQFDADEHTLDAVQTFRPTVVIKRQFTTRPNQNYSSILDPDGAASAGVSSTPSNGYSQYVQSPRLSNALGKPIGADSASPLLQRATSNQQLQQQQRGAAQYNTGVSQPDKGHLGVYSHAKSPLRKSASANFSAANGISSGSGMAGVNGRDARASSGGFTPSSRKSMQSSSPSKRSSYVSSGQGTSTSRSRLI